MTKKRCSKYVTAKSIKRTVIQPCTNVKLVIGKNKAPNDQNLNPEAKDLIKELLSMYPK
ncbi:hypothetical protein CLU79DRAFT_700889 [Phycomyces nitens]|nr:hypothetical protein CLU79DRAFT_700889 [Phycomyces nitens]